MSKPAWQETDYGLANLKRIEEGLRTAKHKQVNGGVLVAEILVDSIDNWVEFLQELIQVVEKAGEPEMCVACRVNPAAYNRSTCLRCVAWL